MNGFPDNGSVPISVVAESAPRRSRPRKSPQVRGLCTWARDFGAWAAERFFREGRAGQWRERLAPAQIECIVRDHGAQMKHFGYLTSDGTPV
jgi:hypothetical protein